MPRASLRSVFTIIAESAAFTCRVSSSTASKPGPVRPACSHCDSGPASSPTRVSGRPSCPKKPTSASGSLGTFASRTILPGRVDHAHAAPFQRDVDPGIVLHGCPS